MPKVTVTFQVSVPKTEDVVRTKKVINSYEEWVKFKETVNDSFPVTIEGFVLKIFKEEK
jgi:hypothetical protein